MSTAIILAPLRLHWIGADDDAAKDLCAHGGVEFWIDGDPLMDPSEDWTVSAAALHLLRTLTRPHDGSSSVGHSLFPCCGFSMYDAADVDHLDEDATDDEVLICGCPRGVDFRVLHRADGGGVVLRGESGDEWEVDGSAWRDSVHGFADRVSDFFVASAPKDMGSDDLGGFAAFLREWERRRGRPLDPRLEGN